MLRLLKLPGAMVELAVGTMIVIVHLGLAGARSARTLPSSSTHGPSYGPN